MGLFNRNRADRPKPTPRGAIIVLCLLVLIGIVAKCIGGTHSPEETQEELAALDLYYKWDGHNVLDDVADAEYLGMEEIDYAGKYFNEELPLIQLQSYMCEEIESYIVAADAEKKDMLAHVKERQDSIGEPEDEIDEALLGIAKEEQLWMERLAKMDTVSIREYRIREDGIREEVQQAEKGKGWLMKYDVRFLKSKTKMHLEFASNEQRDTLVLIAGKRIY